MTLRSPEQAIAEERTRLVSNDSLVRSTIRRLAGTTAIGLSLVLQCSNVRPPHEVETAAAIATANDDENADAPNVIADMESVPTGESLMNRELFVMVENREGIRREVRFRIEHDEDELTLRVGNDVFRSDGSVMGIGKISEIIEDVTAEKTCMRLHSAYGHADVAFEEARDILQSVASIEDGRSSVHVSASVQYAPAKGSSVELAHSLFQSMNGMLGENTREESTHVITFRRDHPVRIAQSGN